MSQSNFSPNSFPMPTTKRRIDSGGPDFYPTPSWATQALVDHESFEGQVCEPACGDGAMAEVLIANGLEVYSFDLHNRGYGIPGFDFLKTNSFAYANVITNPPYSLAEKFVLHALKHTTKKVAMLLRLAFLEGSGRQERIFQKTPPARVWVFSERVTFYPKGEERISGGTTAYAWFVWDHYYLDGTQIKWISLGRKPSSRKSFKSVVGKTLSISDLQ